MNLRDEARGRVCQVRLPNVCNHDPETVVLAHFRLSGLSGFGIKAHDLQGAHACSNCHAYVDSHKDVDTQLAFAHGCFRTIAALVKEGKVTW